MGEKKGGLMKQHITLEQLKELNLRQFIKLYRIIRTKEISLNRIANFHGSILSNGGFGYNKLLSEINVGKMIEMLNVFLPSINIYHLTSSVELWGEDAGSNFKCLGTFEEKELCDALWEAVKNELLKN